MEVVEAAAHKIWWVSAAGTSATQSPSTRGSATARIPAPIAATVSWSDVTSTTQRGGSGSRPKAAPGALPKPSVPPKPSGLSTHRALRRAVTSATCGSLPRSGQQAAPPRSSLMGDSASMGRPAGSSNARSVPCSFASSMRRAAPSRTSPDPQWIAASLEKTISSHRSMLRSMRAEGARRLTPAGASSAGVETSMKAMIIALRR